MGRRPDSAGRADIAVGRSSKLDADAWHSLFTQRRMRHAKQVEQAMRPQTRGASQEPSELGQRHCDGFFPATLQPTGGRCRTQTGTPLPKRARVNVSAMPIGKQYNNARAPPAVSHRYRRRRQCLWKTSATMEQKKQW